MLAFWNKVRKMAAHEPSKICPQTALIADVERSDSQNDRP
jgi:hypothetical protein